MKTLSNLPVVPKENNRRVLKPIIEKRRRERINNHLEELKNLVCGNTRSKLEKADILELTVNHLRKLLAAQRRSITQSTVLAPAPTQPQAPAIAAQPKLDSRQFLPCAQQMQRLLAIKSDDLYAQQQQFYHQQQQRQQRSPTSSCTSPAPSLSPLSPAQTFVFFPSATRPVTSVATSLPQQQIPASSTQPASSASPLWRPW